MWKKILQKEICSIYLENITLILDGTVLKINLRAKNVENHSFFRGSRVSKITCFAASFSASSQVTRETKHFFQLCYGHTQGVSYLRTMPRPCLSHVEALIGIDLLPAL